MGIFGTQKMLICTLFIWGGEGGGVSEIYGLYTHENIDIYGRLVRLYVIKTQLRELSTIMATVEIERDMTYFGELMGATNLLKVHRGMSKVFELFYPKYLCQYHSKAVLLKNVHVVEGCVNFFFLTKQASLSLLEIAAF